MAIVIQSNQLNDILEALGERPPQPPVQVTGGLGGTGIWRFRSSRGRGMCALRVFGASDAGVAARETAVMVHARSVGLPVPEVFAAQRAAGFPVMVIEWFDGGTMLRALRRRPWQAAEMGQRSGDLMLRLHNALAPTGLAPARNWPVVSAFPASLRERLMEPDVRVNCLVHLDFHPANLIVSGDEGDVLIDWTNARAGDPRFDVARTTLIAAMLPGLTGIDRVIARRVIEPYVRAWRAAYLAQTGPLPDMPVFLAWAGYAMLTEWGPEHAVVAGRMDEFEVWKAQLRGLLENWMDAAGLPSSEPV